MRIAYLTSYIGPKFRERYCNGVKYAISGPLKSQGIARSLMASGHEVVIFSPAVTNCNCYIKSFQEEEVFPEGVLTTKYCNIVSKHKFGPINDIAMYFFMRKELKKSMYDALFFYNITFGAALVINLFNGKFKIIDYEDNIFTKALKGERMVFERIKRILYRFIIKRTDYAFVVCQGMLVKNEVKDKLLIPGIINEEVTGAILYENKFFNKEKPTHIIFTGGAHHSKGADLLIESLQHVNNPCIIDFYSNGTFCYEAIAALKHVPDKHKVNLKGYLPHDELMKILSKEADIFICTSIMKVGLPPQTSGFPFKIMEYAALGRPIISSEISKLDETFNSLITYYKGDEPINIAKAIDDVIDNYDQKLFHAGELQKLVLSRYTIQGIGNSVKCFLKKNNVL